MTENNVPISPQDLVCIGAFAGAHGVRGRVRLKSFTANPTDFFDFKTVYTENGKDAYHFLSGSSNGKGIFVSHVREIKTREQAQALKSTKLFALKKDFPTPDSGEFYIRDLIGLTVQAPCKNRTVGFIKAVENYGAGDLLEIELKSTGKRVLFPFTVSSVPELDLQAGTLTVSPSDFQFYIEAETLKTRGPSHG